MEGKQMLILLVPLNLYVLELSNKCASAYKNRIINLDIIFSGPSIVVIFICLANKILHCSRL